MGKLGSPGYRVPLDCRSCRSGRNVVQGCTDGTQLQTPAWKFWQGLPGIAYNDRWRRRIHRRGEGVPGEPAGALPGREALRAHAQVRR